MNSSSEPTPNEDFVRQLYLTVDARDAKTLGAFLAGDVIFQLGNFPAIQGKEAVIDANENFFNSIANMSHQIDEIWEKDSKVFCAGYVHYIRLDESELSIPFSTLLTVQKKKITNYQVYVDVSPL